MADKLPSADAEVQGVLATTPIKKPHAPKEDGFCNPRDGRGPLRKCDDQHAKLPIQ